VAGCGGGDAPAPAPPPPKPIPYETLSEYGLFDGPLADLSPRAGVVPYEVVSPLWADHAGKKRLIALPEGTAVSSDALADVREWQFPEGSILVKTFFFALDQSDSGGDARILETRLLILEAEGWTPHTYVWNDEQTEAKRIIAGARIDIDYLDAAGTPLHEEYLVPNTNQCNSCHERDDVTYVLGPITPQLNRDVDTPGGPRNQLAWLAEQGVLAQPIPDPLSLPAFADPAGSALLDDRARAYLHANCSHCHRPGGGGGPSGLVLLEWERDPLKNGVCKGTAAAGAGTGGHDYDIVPGAPEESIMIFRMGSTDPEIKMPELPNRIPDAEGIALVSAWIAAMEPPGCN
jgi:uncharacterized repeat protein (TIGR03806 family)